MSGGVDSSCRAQLLLVEQGLRCRRGDLGLVGWRLRTRAAARWPTSTTPAGWHSYRASIHHVFNMTEDFDRHVVAPYVGEHARGRTPNPCIECNRTNEVRPPAGRSPTAWASTAWRRPPRPGLTLATSPRRLRRGADRAKDQSYVLSMLGRESPWSARGCSRSGELTKQQVRDQARPPGAAHGGEARQPGCVLHRERGRTPGVPVRYASEPTPADGRGRAGGGRPVSVAARRALVTVGRGAARHGARERRHPALRHLTSTLSARRVTVGGAADASSSNRSSSPGPHAHLGSTARSGLAPVPWRRARRPRAPRALHPGLVRRP